MAKLQAIVKSLDKVAESYHDLYEKQDDDTYRLNVDGVPIDKKAVDEQKTKVAEFRTNNTKLLKENEELKNQLNAFGGLEAKEAKALLETKRKVEEKALIEKGEIEQLVDNRTETMRQQYESQIKKLGESVKERDDGLKARDNDIYQLKVEAAMNESINNNKIKPKAGAHQDIRQRFLHAWRMDEKEKKLVAYDTNGNPVYNESGSELINPKDWLKKLAGDAPHLFEASSGSGAPGSEYVGTGNSQISMADQKAFNDNLEAIRDGKVTVGIKE